MTKSFHSLLVTRYFNYMTLLFLIFLFLAAVFIWALWIEPEQRQINRHQAKIQKPLARPFRILHISDTHFCGQDESLSRFFDRLSKKEEIDFIFVTGDIIDWDGGVDAAVENLKKIKSSQGVFVVFGNHDYFNYEIGDIVSHNFPGQKNPLMHNKIDLFREKLLAAGIKVLRNETVETNVEGTPVLIHGLDDPTTGRADLLKAMKNFNPEKVNILLTHTVDVFLDIGENEIDLSFSGHSHGGQVRLPFIGPIIVHTSLGRPYAAGIFKLKGAVCCVSRGMNASRHLRLRLLCPPEAIIMTVTGR